MKITGTSNVLRRSLTASRPELPSASWISARMRPGGLVRAIVTASVRVRATPMTLWPRFSTNAAIEPNQWFVLDDQDVRGELGRKLPAGLLHQREQRRGIDVKDSRR